MMIDKVDIPQGDKAREAIDALKGYVYQIYQSALAWIELEPDGLLFLEVAEDYATLVNDTLTAVQVKETEHSVTINSEDIITSIDSFVSLSTTNPNLQIRLRHLTTSRIGKEKSANHRIGDMPTLEAWRRLAKTGDIKPLREVLEASKLSEHTKSYIKELNDAQFREDFLQRIHFDCGAQESQFLMRELGLKISHLVKERRGAHSQVESCRNNILIAILQKATQKENRCLDKNDLENILDAATKIPVSRSQFEEQNQLVNKLLASSIPQAANYLSTTRLSTPKPIDEIPFPSAIASRTTLIDNITSALTDYGVSWISGATGVGKTLGARMCARKLGGKWVSINLRSLGGEQVGSLLSEIVNTLVQAQIKGLLIDDLECSLEPYIIDRLLLLKSICDRTDLLLVFTSSKPPSSDFLFSASLPASIEQRFAEFTEHDIQDILVGFGVNNASWARYIHVVSGGGHPQLAIAAIQSMQSNKWDINELRNMNSLLLGNPAIEQVRSRTRERLLNELPQDCRRLLERLSLKFGNFRRGFVLEIAQIHPVVADAGFLFDNVVGSWVDQHEADRYSLSPLLSNLAANTLTDVQKQEIHYQIADLLLNNRSISPIEANSALLSALVGRNAKAIIKLCMPIFTSDKNVLELIAPHLLILTFMRTDTFAYEDDPSVSQIFRGAQLLLKCYESEIADNFQEICSCFEAETIRVKHSVKRNSMALLVYSKVLFSEPKFGAVPKFWELILKVEKLISNPNIQTSINSFTKEINGLPLIGFLFLTQVRQVKSISELLPVFDFLSACKNELRQKLLKPFSVPDFHVDLLVAGAWLSEHKANSIDPVKHSAVFARLEELSKSWDHKELAVCCRKYRATITDEYGKNKNGALEILDEGLKLYGQTNSELVRAKAKVLYRSDDHEGSLDLSIALIEGNAPLAKTEKVFLGREAAISAEMQGDYETARRYYLYGSYEAADCSISEMIPMQVGLLADAALASWHANDRETCLRDFVTVLQKLLHIDSKSSLRAAHCHAVCRHVLLWLTQAVNEEKYLLPDGQEIKIYPGVVSNPEPHAQIGGRDIAPIEIAWYMLAALENYCYFDVGITRNLEDLLPRGRVFEGEVLLTPAKMKKSLKLLDHDLFHISLSEMIAFFAYSKTKIDYKDSFDIENITFGLIPIPAIEQQFEICDLAEQFILLFMALHVFSGKQINLSYFLNSIDNSDTYKVSKPFTDILHGKGNSIDYNSDFAKLLIEQNRNIDKNINITPYQVFELAFKSLQIADKTKNVSILTDIAFDWLRRKCMFILDNQRFLLKTPTIFEESILQNCAASENTRTYRIIQLLQALLPALGLRNESQLRNILKEIEIKSCA